MDDTIDKIRAALADRNAQVVAQRTGLSAFTIYRFMKIQNSRIRPLTVKVLADYLGIEYGQPN